MDIETLHQVVDERDRAYEQRFIGQEKAVAAALAAAKEAVTAALVASEKAIIKAEAASEKRFDSVNEFRAQLSDQAATFMPRAEAEQRTAQNAEKIDKLALESKQLMTRQDYDLRNQVYLDKLDAQTTQFDARFANLSTGLDNRISGLSIYVNEVTSRLDKIDGRSTGLNAGWGYLVGGIGLIGVIISILIRFV